MPPRHNQPERRVLHQRQRVGARWRHRLQQLGHAGALSGQLDSLGQMNAQLQGQAQGLVQVNGGLRKSLQVRLTISLTCNCVVIHL